MTTTLTSALFLRKGKRLIQVTPEQASKLQGAIRDSVLRDGGSPSEVRNLPLHDIGGNPIGYVSYNGRVWIGDARNHVGNVEIPLNGQKTAAQHEAEGWADYQ